MSQENVEIVCRCAESLNRPVPLAWVRARRLAVLLPEPDFELWPNVAKLI